LGRPPRTHVQGNTNPLEVVMASAQPKPDFKRLWAVKDSNLRPWD
jgi:hypothetical protein